MKRKRVVVLGATGSIGESALKVAHDIPDRMEIVGVAANSNAAKLAAVASKEILVMAGEAVMETARKRGVNILPVDSEHNAIFQCLYRGASFQLANQSNRQLGKLPREQVRRIILTASGGPFRKTPSKDF